MKNKKTGIPKEWIADAVILLSVVFILAFVVSAGINLALKITTPIDLECDGQLSWMYTQNVKYTTLTCVD